MKWSKQQKRFYLLVIAIPVMLAVYWSLSISQTVMVFQELRSYEETIKRYPNPQAELRNLQSRVSSLHPDDLSRPEEADNLLLEAVSLGAKKLKLQLEEFPHSHEYIGSKYVVQTFTIRLSGPFGSLLRFVNEMEYAMSQNRLVSAGFVREYHRKRGEKLYCDLTFQTIRKNQRYDQEE